MSRAPDRLDLAWQRKQEIHGWLLAHPGSRMRDVRLAFPLLARNTVAYIVHGLIEDGCATASGVQHGRRYHASGEGIEHLREVTRDAIRAAGQRGGARVYSKLGADPVGRVYGMEAAVNGRYTHRADRKQAWVNQRGQGSL